MSPPTPEAWGWAVPCSKRRRRRAAGGGRKPLYISAHSSVESQAFYKAPMGCVEAREYQAFHVEKEPCDCQLERPLDGR